MSFLEFLDIAKYKTSKWIPIFNRKSRRIWLTLFLIGVLLIIFHKSILRQTGNFLIDVDQPENVDAICVLGGNTFDRANKAEELYTAGYSDQIVCLGENQATTFKSLGMYMPDAMVEQEQLIDLGIPESDIKALVKGTSTKEEVDAILALSEKENYKKIIIVSDLFHTTRIRKTINKVFEGSGTEVLLVGCSNSQYNESSWWRYEQGLIMVNNEYIKLLYYAIKF